VAPYSSELLLGKGHSHSLHTQIWGMITSIVTGNLL
jgi:hypothetical protein